MTRPHDAGFTLTEALVALLVISLSLAGVLQASRIVSHANHLAAANRLAEKQQAAFQAELTAKLTPQQPIVGDDLIGDAMSMRFNCTATTKGNCVVSAPAGSLSYVSAGNSYTSWPPVADGSMTPPRLEAVIWRNALGKTLAVVKLPVEHSRDCQFDMISRTCREDISQP